MKKFLSLMLVCLLVLSFAACSEEENNDDVSFGGGNLSNVDLDNGNDKSSEAESSVIEGDSSDVSGGDEGGDELVYTNKFMTWARRFYATPAMGDDKRGINGTLASDATSLNFTKVDEAVEAGDIGAFTPAFGTDIATEGQDYSEFYVAVYEYNHEVYTYLRINQFEVGSANGEIAIPADGFVVAIHKDHEAKIAVVKGLSDNTPVFPAGLDISDALDTTISAREGEFNIDGKLSEGDWKKIWDMNPDDGMTNYGQFEKGDYPATAEVYMSYDAEYFYLGVIVFTNRHDNKVTSSTLGSMWNSECIQFNITSETSKSEYMSEYWQHAVNPKSSDENVARQYNVCLNNDGESLYDMTMNESAKSDMKFKVTYENNQLVYEIAIPWSECGKDGETIEGVAGTEFGFALSVNYCKPEVVDGVETSVFRTIMLRDGGSVIGINDFSKIPTITLG